MFSTAVKYAKPNLLRVALTDSEPGHLKAALTGIDLHLPLQWQP